MRQIPYTERMQLIGDAIDLIIAELDLTIDVQTDLHAAIDDPAVPLVPMAIACYARGGAAARQRIRAEERHRNR